MKAIRVNKFGGPEVLQLEDIPIPEPEAAEVRVKIEAIGVNFVDTKARAGIDPAPLPFTPGVEASGVVDAVGIDVTDFKPGDRVAYVMHRGSYAEYTTVPPHRLAHIPDSLEFLDAAGLMVTGLTAHYMTTSAYPIRDGDMVLIHASVGAVGSMLVQMAKLRGATVIGTTSTEKKAHIARELGADHTILYTEIDFVEEVKKIAGEKGLDAVYDSAGKETFEKDLQLLKQFGTIVLFGQTGGAADPFNPHLLNQHGSLYLTYPSLRHYAGTQELVAIRSKEVFDWFLSGKIKLQIDRVLPLANAAEAHRVLANRENIGKIILQP
jgi:NADPH2:quinone reductase